MKRLLFFPIYLSFVFTLFAQNGQALSPIIFIYDASGSMWGQMDGKTKMAIATDVLSSAVNNLPENQPVGLVAYGHRTKGDCEDVEFLVHIDNIDKSRVTQSLAKIKPLGRTPLAYSAIQVIEQLRNSQVKATVILLTDGIESCNGNICDVIKAAKEEGIDFRLHIIGFGLKEGETEQLRCAASAGEGQYYDAADAGRLSQVLDEATQITIDDPAANFSVFAIKNGKPIDAYVKVYKAGTKTDITSSRTYSDTAMIYLPPDIYDLEVNPLENSDVMAITVPNVQSFAEKITHQTVSFDAGKIQVTSLNNGEGWDAVVQIFLKANGAKVAQGRTYGKADVYELNPGIYDVELKALNIKGSKIIHRIENVEVIPNEELKLEYNFSSGIALIGANSQEGLVDAVVSISEIDGKKSVANGRTYTSDGSNPKKFILSPGNYEVTLSALGTYKGKKESFKMVISARGVFEKTINFSK